MQLDFGYWEKVGITTDTIRSREVKCGRGHCLLRYKLLQFFSRFFTLSKYSYRCY